MAVATDDTADPLFFVVRRNGRSRKMSEGRNHKQTCICSKKIGKVGILHCSGGGDSFHLQSQIDFEIGLPLYSGFWPLIKVSVQLPPLDRLLLQNNPSCCKQPQLFFILQTFCTRYVFRERYIQTSDIKNMIYQ